MVDSASSDPAQTRYSNSDVQANSDVSRGPVSADGFRCHRIQQDMDELLHYKPVVEYVLAEWDLKTVRQMFDCLDLLTGMDPQVCAMGEHVQFEGQDWYTAGSLEVSKHLLSS